MTAQLERRAPSHCAPSPKTAMSPQPFPALAPHRLTRCELCTAIVWPQFSECYSTCARNRMWRLCRVCGTMCVDGPLGQACACTHEGSGAGWVAGQLDAKTRVPPGAEP